MLSPEGTHGAMPFDVFEKLVRDASVKDVSFHYEKEGAQRGLPPDVATAMFGTPADGLSWNVRKGEIPEYTVTKKTPVMDPLQQLAAAVPGAMVQRNVGRSDVGPMKRRARKFVTRIVHLGWREVLSAMLSKGLLRETPGLTQWLGTDRVAATQQRRKRLNDYDAVTVAGQSWKKHKKSGIILPGKV